MQTGVRGAEKNELSMKCQVPKCEQEGPLLPHLGCCTATFLGC